MIKLISSLVKTIIGIVGVYSRKILVVTVVSSITAVTSTIPKKLVVSYNNKLVQATTINKVAVIIYSNITARVIIGLDSLGLAFSDTLNISSVGTALVQNYVDNGSYFLEDYVGSSINITQ